MKKSKGLSVLLVLSLLLVMLQAAFPVGLAGSVSYQVSDISQEAFDRLGDNLLEDMQLYDGKTWEALEHDRGSTGTSNTTALLTDGALLHPSVANKQALLFYNAVGMKLAYALDGTYTISDIVVAGYAAEGAEDLAIAQYRIYVSDDRASLFDQANCVAEYQNTSKTAAHHFAFGQDSLPTGRFVGFMIVEPNTREKENSLWLNQLAVFGSGDAPYTVDESPNTTGGLDAMADGVKALGTNHLSQAAITFTDGNGSVRSKTTSDDGKALTKLTDGVLREGVGLKFWNGDGTTVAADMGNRFTAGHILVSGGMGDSDMTVVNASSPGIVSYKLYLSDNEDTLFEDYNCIARYQNDSGSPSQLIALQQERTGRYFGIRILDANATSTNLYLGEIGLYGSFGSGDYEVLEGLTQTAGTSTGRDDFGERLGSNILQGKTGYINRLLNGTEQGWLKFADYNGGKPSSGTFAMLTDGVVNHAQASSCRFWDGYINQFKIVYDLEDTYRITKLLVAGQSTSYAIGTYAVYVGDDLETLFDSENRVMFHDNLTWSEGKTEGASQGFLLGGSMQATGRFVGYEFIAVHSSVPAATVLSINELGAYGYPDDGTYTVTEGISPEAYANLGTNLLSGAALQRNSPTNPSGVIDVPENERKILTDGVIHGTARVLWSNTSVDNYACDIWADLGSTMAVDSLAVSGYYGDQNNYGIGHYEIYIADTRETLFEPENRVVQYYNASYEGSSESRSGQVQVFRFGQEKPQGRYYGIRILDSAIPLYPTNLYSYNLRLSELAVFGNDAAAGYTVVMNPSAAEIEALDGNVFTGRTPYDSTGNLFADTDVLSDGEVYTGEASAFPDADGMQLYYDLGVSHSIASLLVGGLYDPQVNTLPLHYRIYVADTIEALFDEQSLAVNYYNTAWAPDTYTYAGSTQAFILDEPAEGRYVGFAFPDASGSDQVLRLTELSACGKLAIPLEQQGIDAAAVWADGIRKPGAQDDGLVSGVSSGQHTVVVEDTAGSQHVYFVSDGLFTYKSELLNALVCDETGIRFEEPRGLRFITTLSAAARQDAALVKYGTVVARRADLEDQDLVLEGAYPRINAVAYSRQSGMDVIYAQDGSDVRFTAMLKNIKAKNYATTYAARPYMVFETAEGSFTVYGNTVKKTIASAAADAVQDAQTAEDKAYLEEILAHASLSDAARAHAESLNVTADMLAASIVSGGDTARLANVLRKAQRGEDITIGVLGGSITQGSGADKGKAYADRLQDWLQNAFPDINVSLVNAGLGSTTSVIGVHRIEADLLSHDPDIVVVEYAVNEGDSQLTRETYEGVVRRVLADENEIALLMLFTMKDDGTNNQEVEMTIGAHYNVPMISYRDAIWPAIADEENTDFVWGTVSNDTIHPNNFGHEIVGVLLGSYIAGVYEELDSAGTQVSTTLKEPLYSDSFMDAILWSSTTIPSDALVTNGCMEVNRNAFVQFKDGWTARYEEGKTNDPLVVSILDCRSITLLVLRIKDTKAVNATVTTVTDGTYTTKNALNYLGVNSSYADAVQVYSSDTAKDVTLRIEPQLDEEGEYFTLLGIMVA